jgi:hypothetical protein
VQKGRGIWEERIGKKGSATHFTVGNTLLPTNTAVRRAVRSYANTDSLFKPKFFDSCPKFKSPL